MVTTMSQTTAAESTSGLCVRGVERIPAVIFVSKTALFKVASLTVLDRLVVAIHRAGAGPISLVAPGALPELKRSRALKIPISVAPEAPSSGGRVLIAASNLMVQAPDVRRCIEQRARLISREGIPLPLGLAELPDADIGEALSGAAECRAEGVAALVVDRASALAAEKCLWASLTSSSDGFVDKIFNRPCGRPLSKLFIHTPVTPNAVSIISVLIGVASAFFFAVGSPRALIIGAILFQLSAVIDCVDGDIARAVFKESPLGKWIDIVGDQVVHISVFAGIALGVYRASPAAHPLILGASAMAGAAISFLVVLRGLRQGSGGQGLLQRLIDAATNRDFSVLVFLLACFQRLDIFLWLSAIGSHFFWIAALALQLAAPRSSRPRK